MGEYDERTRHAREGSRDEWCVPHEQSGQKAEMGRVTDALLDELMTSASPEAYLASSSVSAGLDDRDLADYLRDISEANGVTRAEAIRACGINATFGYQIFSGDRRTSRDNAIMLAFGLRCDLYQAQRLLTHAGHAELYSRDRRDAVIIFCLVHGYDRMACDDELYKLGLRPLFDVESAGRSRQGR